MDIIIVLTILTLAVFLFATSWLRMDLVSLMVLLALVLTGMVSPTEAFSGFSNPAVITVAAMFVLSAAISGTGAVTRAGEYLVDRIGTNAAVLTAGVMLTAAVLSAFINNIGSVAIMMPIIITIAKKMNTPPSKLLIPLAFGSLLGGVCTLIGTPPNILINSLLQEYTGEEFAMFDFTPLGLVLLVCGVLYMVFIGRHLLPNRKSGTLTEAYQVKEYVTEVQIQENSSLVGKTIAQSSLELELGMKVRAILRNRIKIPQPRRNRKFLAGDVLLLAGDPLGILKVREKRGLTIIPERDNPSKLPSHEDMVVVEASLTPTSDMVGKTLRRVRFADTHGLTVLAIWRRGAPVVRRVDQVVLNFGDVLLLQGAEEKVRHLGAEHGFLLLGGVEPTPYRPQRAQLALAIMLGVIILAATGTLPITVAAVLGALLMVLCGCLDIREAYQSIDWSILVLIAGTLPLGHAMENSGAAHMIADQLLAVVGPFGPWAALAAVFFLTSCLTELMSHAAAAVLIAPIAYNTALTLGVSPRPFFMGVAIAASMCFMTPISHQSNALVMGPGGYHFFDYVKVGTALNLLVWVVASFLLPFFFPF